MLKIACICILLFSMILFNCEWVQAYDLGGVEIDVIGSAGETYDDNITYVKDSAKRDFITALMAGLTAKYEGKRGTADFRGSLTQSLYGMHNNYNNLSELASLSATYEISKRTRMKIVDDFSHTYEPRSFEEAFGVQRGIYSYFRNRFTADYMIDVAKNIIATLTYRNYLDVPSRSEISTSYLNLGGAEVDYYITSKALVYGYYNFSARAFDTGKQAITHSQGGGGRYYITNQLYVDARGGIDYLVSYDKTTYWRPMVNASLTGELNKTTTAAVSFIKQYQMIAYQQNLFNYWQISATLMKQFTQRLRLVGDIFYGNGEYVTVDITDDLFGGGAAVEYELTKRVKAKASYRYSRTDSNVDTREYIKNTVYAGFNVEF